MFSIFVSLALAATPSPAAERKAWYECLEAYAQIAMFSTKMTPAIALDALKACADERKAFQLKLLRVPSTPSTVDGPSFAARLAEEDRAAAAHTVWFLTVIRRR
jgi:hypothetical protein